MLFKRSVIPCTSVQFGAIRDVDVECSAFSNIIITAVHFISKLTCAENML